MSTDTLSEAGLSINALADVINRARYVPGGIPERGIDEEDQGSRDYAFRLARAVSAYIAATQAAPVAVVGLTYGQKLIAEAIEAHFGERVEDYDEDVDDTSNRAAWEAFDATLSPTLAVPGDVLEQPKPCGLASPSYNDCPNMKEVGGGMEGERYWCAICSKGYFLDYEDMK